jgi:hypothetical protein
LFQHNRLQGGQKPQTLAAYERLQVRKLPNLTSRGHWRGHDVNLLALSDVLHNRQSWHLDTECRTDDPSHSSGSWSCIGIYSFMIRRNENLQIKPLEIIVLIIFSLNCNTSVCRVYMYCIVYMYQLLDKKQVTWLNIYCSHCHNSLECSSPEIICIEEKYLDPSICFNNFPFVGLHLYFDNRQSRLPSM